MKNITVLVIGFLMMMVTFTGCTPPNVVNPGCVGCATENTATATPTNVDEVATATPTATDEIATATATMTSTEIVIATATVTATVTPNLVYGYVKITGDTPSTTSNFGLRVWTNSGGVKTYLFGTASTWPNAVIGESNPVPWVWTSTTSDGYATGTASLNYAFPLAPSNQGIYVEFHLIINGVDTLVSTASHYAANFVNGGGVTSF